jgi:hypothetical protein
VDAMTRPGRTKLKSEKIWFHRESGKSEFIKITYVDKHDGEFIIPYPAEVTAKMNCKPEARNKDLDVANRIFNKMLKDFAESNETKRKVILYDLCYEDGIQRYGSNNSGISFSDGLCISLCASIFTETDTTRPDGTHIFSYERIEGSDNTLEWALRRGSHGDAPRTPGCGKKATDMIPWSEENEAFFNMFAKAMLSLIERMKHMTEKPENLLAMIAMKTNLLGAPEKDPTIDIPAEGPYRD